MIPARKIYKPKNQEKMNGILALKNIQLKKMVETIESTITHQSTWVVLSIKILTIDKEWQQLLQEVHMHERTREDEWNTDIKEHSTVEYGWNHHTITYQNSKVVLISLSHIFSFLLI